jgi:hypothetical protein
VNSKVPLGLLFEFLSRIQPQVRSEVLAMALDVQVCVCQVNEREFFWPVAFSLLFYQKPKNQKICALHRRGDRALRTYSSSPEMEFLDINLTKDLIILLHAVHSPFYWRISRRSSSSLVLIIITKESTKQGNLSLFMNSILQSGKIRLENWTKIRVWVWENSSLCPETSTKKPFKNSISGLRHESFSEVQVLGRVWS